MEEISSKVTTVAPSKSGVAFSRLFGSKRLRTLSTWRVNADSGWLEPFLPPLTDSVEVDRRGLGLPLRKSKSWGPQVLGGRLWSTQSRIFRLFFSLWAFEERRITRIQYPSNTQTDLKSCRLSVTPHGSELQCSTLKLETTDFSDLVKGGWIRF